MKTCLNCQNTWELPHSWECEKCGFEPNLIMDSSNILAFDLELSTQSGQFFDKESFHRLYQIEERSFWFRARNKLIIALLKKYCSQMTSFFELGCGTGFVLNEVRQHFKSIRLLGADVYTESLPFVKERLRDGAQLMQMDGRKIPFKEEFDVIGAFDVLEHIKEDEAVIQQMHHALKPNGRVILAVPQHPSLWSITDEIAFHERRYLRTELQDKLKSNGFNIIYTTSFVATLLPLMWLSRKRKEISSHELAPNKLVNKSLVAILTVEKFLIQIGVRFPIGGSRFVVAEKI